MVDSSPAALCELLNGPGDGQQWKLTTGTSIVGTDGSCEVSLRYDGQVSARHARLVISDHPATIQIEPLEGSVLVDGQVISAPCVLDGDMIVRLGQTELGIDWIPTERQASDTSAKASAAEHGH